MMSDLVLGENTDLTTLLWVDDNARRWEPEPFRWLGVKTATFLGARADKAEANGGTSRFWSGLFDLF